MSIIKKIHITKLYKILIKQQMGVVDINPVPVPT